MTKEKLERYLAEGLSLEQIGRRVGRNPSTISYHLKKHGLKPVNRQRHLRRGAIPEGELRALHASGASLAEIAENSIEGSARCAIGSISTASARPTAAFAERRSSARDSLASARSNSSAGDTERPPT